ncbi:MULTISPECIES: FAD-binding oxidoreductase [unclassified Novosphingobium]|uniref:NAD(P)/FAD-dependent oxidoreductase n=1 Tax=unclassified Novosphingobium TaxID=2644732 RepID=UPI0017F5F294|nr:MULTISPECIES: FAD-binding oxidoreductase [unclassified Novosphingobium]MBB3356460.1 gamma-glutamylputrescine oxidase [Novosphingobium sp. BK256]MBB3372861.1 gamma-glutamylputrescine oxidase [Novosphingobium sp. BK280]MBB3377229.1 gamma-glutamylputrescine oxidase [Novosphingobium sp. BK258]MBB3419360.1 gamma-glutamylputrescine oxidase [Novosphingobium sp. BK267]MBB3448823.1 gamma-glutamylputrescine oxidase [Novosphingobium sp. BK352]
MDMAVPGLHQAAPYAGMPTWYAASANPAPQRPVLQGAQRATVCVIGAGFTGLSVALELAEKGIDVIVLESERVGWGASGRNGGQLINGYSRGLDVLEARHGPAVARALGAVALEGAAIIRDRVARYGIACDLVDGGLGVALNARQMRALEDEQQVWAAHGHAGITVLDREALRAHVQSDRYVGGILDPLRGHFHPLNYLLGEAAAFEQLGGRLFEHSRVTRVDDSGPRPRVVTAQGEVIADTLVVCGNAYLGKTLPWLSGQIMPVSSQVVTTEPLGELAAQLLPSNACVEDANYILDYFRRTADGRLLYGGGIVYGGQDPASVEAKIRPGLIKTFPQLKDVKLEFAWSGTFAMTLSRMPQIGRLSPKVFYSHGDSGHGVTTTQLLGRLLGEAIAGQHARFDVFANLPHPPFPGGQRFRAPLSTLGSLWYTLRDRLGV